ncbi:MAG TPA: glycosyltransferase, partial [Pseudosphingobacterium sp.]|nr:glycosyltransferase [Pseudosphingobacterium sp.]
EGGPLTILQDCACFLNANYTDDYDIYAIVNNAEVIKEYEYIKPLVFPDIKKSWFKRLYFEYYQAKEISRQYKPYLWLSLHDITPNADAEVRAVYCHNPSIFRKTTLSDLREEPSLFIFSLLYKYLYKININKNSYVIVQQGWLKEAFAKLFKLPLGKIVVAKPEGDKVDSTNVNTKHKEDAFIHSRAFFFPAFPRPFKNFEVIGEAVKLLNSKKISDFEVYITLNGTENRYAKRIRETYGHLKNIRFIGLISRDEVADYYSTCKALIFPSKLESWGLPISEFKGYAKPMLIADLPYARETIGTYNKVSFFDPDKPLQLANLMEAVLDGNANFEITKEQTYAKPFAKGWKELFEIMLPFKQKESDSTIIV